MPRPPFSIQQVYIADGFADDCDELVHRCSRADVLNYRTFCMHYKEMNFASVFQGRTSNAEIAELSEELIHIAKHYMVLDTSNFEESIAGLFLVYALLNLQPYPRFAALRLVPDDLPAIERIERVARRDRRHDVLYVLGSVLIRGPVQYQAASRPRGMEGPIRKYLDGFCNIDMTGVRPKGVYYRQNEELDIIRDTAGIFKRYSLAKSLIPGLKGRALSHSNDNLAADLAASLKRVISGITTEEASSSDNREDMVQEIKKRAMTNTVGVVRHLDSFSQRSPEKKIQQQETPTTPKTSANRKLSPKRRPLKPRQSPPKKRTKKSYDTSSSSSDTDEDIEDWCVDTPRSLKAIEEPEVKDIPTEQEIHVEIDSLPPLITTEMNGKLVEIEIIDEMKKGNEMKKGDEIKKGNETAKRNRMNKEKETTQREEITKGDEIKKGDEIIQTDEPEDGPDKEDKKESEDEKDKPKRRGRPKKEETAKTDEEIFKRPLRVSPRLHKIAKRDMKKPVLKSKFRKMGMLPVANFDDVDE